VRRRYRSWTARSQRKVFFSDQFDLYHEPNFIPVPTSLPIVATVHDLSVLLHPEWHPAERVRWYEEEFARSLEQVDHIITVSEFTRGQVLRVLGLAGDRVTSVANGQRPEFRPVGREAVAEVLRRRRLSDQYLLYVGTIEPRKNILRLMQAYISLPSRLRRGWPLILVGGWGWNINAERAFYEEIASHEGVRHLGYLPDEDLPALFNGARALLYPSLYEGFGLPPLEMMACGGAVLASDIPPHVEVAGGAAHLINPEDIEGWRDAMANVILDYDWHKNLCARGLTRAQEFSWSRCAAETTQVYRRVLEAAGSCVAHPASSQARRADAA
jgi:alpha-1,3-rhamnosyl/mannosyltransferase